MSKETDAGHGAVACRVERPVRPLRRGVDGVCTRSTCECEREGLGDQCIWLRPTDAELERRTGEPHIDGWPLYSGLPPPADTAQFSPHPIDTRGLSPHNPPESPTTTLPRAP